MPVQSKTESLPLPELPVLPEETKEKLRAALEACAQDPDAVRDWGTQVEKVIRHFGLMRLSTTHAQMIPPETAAQLAEALGLIEKAEKIFAPLVQDAPQTPGSSLAPNAKQTMLSKIGLARDNNSITPSERIQKAAAYAGQAGLLMVEVFPKIDDILDAQKTGLRHKTACANAFDKILTGIDLYQAVAQETLADWRTPESGVPTQSIANLDRRLNTFAHMAQQMASHATTHAQLLKIEDLYTATLEETAQRILPTTPHVIADFMEQVDLLQRSDVIASLHKTSQRIADGALTRNFTVAYKILGNARELLEQGEKGLHRTALPTPSPAERTGSNLG